MRSTSHLPAKKIYFISLGCPKNLVDSEKIIGSLGAAGAVLTSVINDSDVIVINTCGFIEPALEETEKEIQKARRFRDKIIYVYGCAVNRRQKKLKEKYPDVAAWFKLEEKNKLLDSIVAGAVKKDTRLITTKGYAYLKIADGCSNHCAYCTVPSIKGEYRSVDIDSLITEAYELVRLGTREIILIGQDTTRYGTDLYGKPMLDALLGELSRIRNLKWLRIMYAHPKTVTRAVIAAIAENPKVCKYLDLPIQHINDRILGLMNRGVDRRRIETIVCELEAIKGMSLRTTVITGFPGETEEEFLELEEFLREEHFSWLGAFPYCAEPATKAAQYKQLPPSTIQSRYQKILELQKKIIISTNKKRLGETYKVLIHGRNGKFVGHAAFNAPEIDSQIVVTSKKLKLGNFYDLKLSRVKGTNLYAS